MDKKIKKGKKLKKSKVFSSDFKELNLDDLRKPGKDRRWRTKIKSTNPQMNTPLNPYEIKEPTILTRSAATRQRSSMEDEDRH
ncbi:hypothetical protein U1Q18_027250, partial [Sarracenia purpurea var. burkii]